MVLKKRLIRKILLHFVAILALEQVGVVLVFILSPPLNCPPGSNPTVGPECFTRFCTLHTFFMHLEKPLCSNSSFRAGGSCPRFHTLPSIGLPTRLESHYSCRHCLLVVHIHSKYTMYCVVIVAQNTSAL